MHFWPRLIYNFFRLLPLGLALTLGRLIGLGMFYRRKRRRAALNTIKQAFPGRSYPELYSLVRGSFIGLGMSLVETLFLDRLAEKVEGVYAREPEPGGQVIVGIHQGSWELYNAWFGRTHPFAVLVREQKQGALNSFLNELRKKSGVMICEGIRQLVRLLDQGYWTGLMLDHGAEANAVSIDFFGHSLPAAGGAVRLAKKFKRKIYPAFGMRSGSGHRVLIGPAFDPEGKEEREVLAELNSYYEQMLKDHPEQYLWSYRRFKRKKDRSVLVLSDGKAGHVKQSLSLVSFLRERCPDLRVKQMEMCFPGRGKRFLAEICAFLSRWPWCTGYLFLRFLLPPDIFASLDRDCFDIVISTGSIAAPVNVLVSRLSGARSCAVLKPNLPLSFFDLTLIPEHDRCQAANTLTVKGALTRFDDLEEQAAKGKHFFGLDDSKKVSLFVGASQKDQKVFLSNLETFLKELKQFSLKGGYNLLVTTSRRTTPEAEAVIDRELEGFENTEVLVKVSEKNYPFVVPSFLSFSEIVFVTAESVSMISESANLDKTTVAVFLEEPAKPQHRIFLESLKDGFVNFLAFPYNRFSFDKPRRSLRGENEAVLKEAAARLL